MPGRHWAETTVLNILHLMRLVFRTRPSPLQVWQGVMRSPVPLHSLQSDTCTPHRSRKSTSTRHSTEQVASAKPYCSVR